MPVYSVQKKFFCTHVVDKEQMKRAKLMYTVNR